MDHVKLNARREAIALRIVELRKTNGSKVEIDKLCRRAIAIDLKLNRLFRIWKATKSIK